MRLTWQIAFFAHNKWLLLMARLGLLVFLWLCAAPLMLGMAAIWFGEPRIQYNMSTTIVPPAEYYEDWRAFVPAEWDI